MNREGDTRYRQMKGDESQEQATPPTHGTGYMRVPSMPRVTVRDVLILTRTWRKTAYAYTTSVYFVRCVRLHSNRRACDGGKVAGRPPSKGCTGKCRVVPASTPLLIMPLWISDALYLHEMLSFPFSSLLTPRWRTAWDEDLLIQRLASVSHSNATVCQ